MDFRFLFKCGIIETAEKPGNATGELRERRGFNALESFDFRGRAGGFSNNSGINRLDLR